jgi:hypothetical protein
MPFQRRAGVIEFENVCEYVVSHILTIIMRRYNMKKIIGIMLVGVLFFSTDSPFLSVFSYVLLTNRIQLL